MIGARVSQNNFETPQLLLVSPMGKRPTLGVDGYLDGWMERGCQLCSHNRRDLHLVTYHSV